MANVMKPTMGRVPGPYSDNAYIPTATHGWVHANTWYASAPFNSAPPPAPAGINPQTWANGQWQPNPYFRPPAGMTQPPNAFQMWAPHPGWAQAMQSWNPYKRVPKPGDPSYWATQLSDNPLMLENMHIRDDTPAEERHRKDSSNGVPHTPWVWVPKELGNDTGKSTGNAGASAPREGQNEQNGQTHQAQAQREPHPAPSAHRRETYDHARTNSTSRNGYAPPATAHDASSQSRHYQYDASRSAPAADDRSAPSSAPANISTYSAYHQQQQQQTTPQRQQQYQHDTQRTAPERYDAPSQHQDAEQRHRRQPSRSRDISPRRTHDSQGYPAREYRGGPTPAVSSSASAAAAAAARQPAAESSTSAADSTPRDSRQDEAFSSKKELLPTFSPNIVRTPDYYLFATSLPGSTRRFAPSTPTPSQSRIYGPSPTPTRSNSLNAGRQQSQSSTSPSAANFGLISFTEEPDCVLSPLVVPNETPPASAHPSPHREIARSQTYPSVAFDHPPSNREHPVFRKTPREPPREVSPERGDWRDYRRPRDEDATPQPSTRTPPAQHTPLLSHYTRPSPEGRSNVQQVSRSQTYPVVSPPPITPQRSRSPRYSPQGQSQGQYGSPHGQSPHGQSQSYSSSSYQHSGTGTYTRTSPNPPVSSISNASSPLRHNPLPRPPQQSPYVESLTRGSSSASAAAAAVAAQQQQQQQQQQHQATQRRQVRYGYWNKRGDHLFIDEEGRRFIVYAPRHLANPADLKDYPSPTEGFRDHHGNTLKYDPGVPELMDSLPLHGEAPRRPYQSFVSYVNV